MIPRRGDKKEEKASAQQPKGLNLEEKKFNPIEGAANVVLKFAQQAADSPDDPKMPIQIAKNAIFEFLPDLKKKLEEGKRANLDDLSSEQREFIDYLIGKMRKWQIEGDKKRKFVAEQLIHFLSFYLVKNLSEGRPFDILLQPISIKEENKAIVLDSYAFDVFDILHIRDQQQNKFKNPYTGKNFSSEAKKALKEAEAKIHSEPKLKHQFKQFKAEQKKNEEKGNISRERFVLAEEGLGEVQERRRQPVSGGEVVVEGTGRFIWGIFKGLVPSLVIGVTLLVSGVALTIGTGGFAAIMIAPMAFFAAREVYKNVGDYWRAWRRGVSVEEIREERARLVEQLPQPQELELQNRDAIIDELKQTEAQENERIQVRATENLVKSMQQMYNRGVQQPEQVVGSTPGIAGGLAIDISRVDYSPGSRGYVPPTIPEVSNATGTPNPPIPQKEGEAEPEPDLENRGSPKLTEGKPP